MITLNLDIHDFIYAVEGFARGSHLRQHVWQDIVYASIPQMDDDDMDCAWYFMRRDLYGCFFYADSSGKQVMRCGYDDFIHALAALHRGNRYIVAFKGADGKKHTSLCYRFGGNYRPLHVIRVKGKKYIKTSLLESFNAIVPEEWILAVEKQPMPDNKFVQEHDEAWWTNLSFYDNTKQIWQE